MRFATVMLGVFGLIVLLTSPVSAQYYARGGHYGDGWPADAGNQLNDDGLNGDAMAGDGIHSGYVTSDKVAGDYEFKIAVEDWSENYPASNVPIRLTSDNQVIFFSLNTNLIEDGCVPTQYIVWSDAIRVGTTWSVVGSAAELGGWDLPSAPQASEDGGLWTLSVDFAAGGDYEYKWVADLDWGFQQVGSDGFGNNTWGIQLHLDDAATVVFTLDLSVPRACHEALVPTEMSLCEATLLDGDYFPVHYDEWVHITSPLLILNDDGTFSSGNVDAGATDGECCVCLFDFNVTDVLMAGDLVDVIGTVAFYNGKTQITDLVLTVISSGNPLPDPEAITTEELSINGEAYESCLISICGLEMDPGQWPAEGSNASIDVWDDTGVVITLRIDKETDIDGSAEPVTPFTCIGLGGQYDYSSPYADYYQLLPRSTADVLSGVDCPPEAAACCFPDGSCQNLLPDDCDLAGGVLYPDFLCETPGFECPQPPPEWACCIDEVCTMMTEDGCAAAGGDFYPNEVCATAGGDFECPVYRVCCVGEECTITLEADCTGDWHPEWDSCGPPNPCETPVPNEPNSWGVIKAIYR